MTEIPDKARTKFLVENVLPDVVSDMLAASGPSARGEESLLREATAIVVAALLDPSSAVASRHLPGVSEIGPVRPEEVGEIYQHLRSFRLDLSKDGSPVLVPCVHGRRNQGLFYTPEPVVRYIVERALDALGLVDPADYLDVRIVDPAVGTGVFLVEALEQLAGRVLRCGGGNSPSYRRIEDLRSRFVEEFQAQGLNPAPDSDAAVRAHIVRNCLCGVDSDPIAVAIARTVLLQRACRDDSISKSIEPNLRVGNALIGQGWGDPSVMTREAEDLKHASACGGQVAAGTDSLAQWCSEIGMFHWPLEFPEIVAAGRGGFDAVIGNPPYEIVSVKESGIRSREFEQHYYRHSYLACKGKINTYRLMIERGLNVLRDGGVLGFIVPATLLADSTAEPLRKEILDRSVVLDTVVIPEKARVFEGVTQAALILVARKGGRTSSARPAFWDGREPVQVVKGAELPRGLIEKTGLRIALIRSEEEKTLLEALLRHPPLGGKGRIPPVGRVHQGEVNLTVHRSFITAEPTGRPLVRGEHVTPLKVVHPAAKANRLDWVKPEFFRQAASVEPALRTARGNSRRSGGMPWEQERIVLGRVVNMETRQRLKAAIVPAGTLLGDMTNYIANATAPLDYLTGLLNSSVLNWRVKLTSTNNYLSAAEIEALPIPRFSETTVSKVADRLAQDRVDGLLRGEWDSPAECLTHLARGPAGLSAEAIHEQAASMLRHLVRSFGRVPSVVVRGDKQETAFWTALDAVVFLLYGVERFAGLENFAR